MLKHLEKKTPFCSFFLFAAFIAFSCFPNILFGNPRNTSTNNSPSTGGYTYTLAPEKTDKPDEYSRKEIENTLCALALYYISTEDTYLDPNTNRFTALPKKEYTYQKKWVENLEISKWFEDEVTVTSRGNLSAGDSDTIKKFFGEVNRITGKDRFTYKPDLPTAHIVVEFFPDLKTDEKDNRVGVTTILEDNLAVEFNMKDSQIYSNSYIAGFRKQKNDLKSITFSPPEKEFMKKNRLVKISIGKIGNQGRDFVIIHELIHSLGLPGHSPYYESNLFPNTILSQNENITGSFLPPLAEKMVEMLYRPEILPGMKIKEAGEVWTRLKLKNKTSKADTVSYFLEKQKRLNEQKESLLREEKKVFEQKTNLFIELDKLERTQDLNLSKLAKIRNKPLKDMIPFQSDSTRNELILLEIKKQKLTQPSQLDKEIEILKEALLIMKDSAEIERKIENITEKDEIATSFRQVLRQLSFIETELKKN